MAVRDDSDLLMRSIEESADELETHTPHTIPILGSTGSGRTELAAFHAALVALDVGHYNLIRLSSVVPPGVQIDGTGVASGPTGGWGDRLYCVYGEQRAAVPGQEAWAGIGWVQRLDGGGGFLVEHEGEDEEMVASAIEASLRDMTRASPGKYSQPQKVVAGTRCIAEPVCALVMAPFVVTPWSFSIDSRSGLYTTLDQSADNFRR